MPLAPVLGFMIFALPWLWMLGIHVADSSRILTGVMIGMLVFRRDEAFERLSPWFRKSLGIYLLLFIPFMAAAFWARLRLGSVGLDFTIFTQVVDNIARIGEPITSLLGLEWKNFMSHHFDLFLYLPAMMVRMGGSAAVALVLLHLMSISMALFFLDRLLRNFKISSLGRICLIAPLALIPTFRHALFWSVHDEVFGIGFMAASWASWRMRHIVPLVLSLTVLCLIKESMGLWASCFAFLMLVEDLFAQKSQKSLRVISVIFLFIGLFTFVGYVTLQPWIFGKSFDHLQKVASIEDLLNPHALMEKAFFFFTLIFPFAILLFGQRLGWRDWLLFLPAMPFLGILAITTFTEMWKPLNYYGVVPSFTILLASIDIIGRTKKLPRVAMILLLIASCFTLGSMKPSKMIAKASMTEALPPLDLRSFPPESRLAVSPGAMLGILKSESGDPRSLPFPGRAFYYQALGQKPDGVILQAGEEGDFPQGFLDGMKPCNLGQESNRWTVLCPPS